MLSDLYARLRPYQSGVCVAVCLTSVSDWRPCQAGVRVCHASVSACRLCLSRIRFCAVVRIREQKDAMID